MAGSFDLLAFGEALYHWRTALGWSQARLAREIDVDVASPMRWENGRNKPHQRLVNRLRALGFVPPKEELIEMTGPRSEP